MTDWGLLGPGRLIALVVAVLALPCAWALPPEVPPHQLHEQRWGVADGMPQITGKDVLQAGNGMIWIGTQDGTVRFDGHEFEVFHPDTHAGLGHNHVNALAEDAEGRIWIGHESGLSVFKGDRFHAVDFGEERSGPVRDLAVDAGRDRVWAATEHGLFEFRDTSPRRIEGVAGSLFSITHDPVHGPFAGGRGELWWQEEGQWHQHVLPEDRSDDEFTALLVSGDTLLVGTSDGMYQASPGTDPAHWHRTLDGHEIHDLLIDRHDTLWISSVSGLYRQLSGDAAPAPVVTGYITASEWLHRLSLDDRGHLWVGTQANGVIRLAPSPFRRFTEVDGLIDGMVWSFEEDRDGTVWVGTNDQGLFRQIGERFEQAVAPDALPHPMVMGIYADEEGNRLWVNTRGGVAWFDRSTLEPLDTPADLPERNVSRVFRASDGRYWMASFEGLYWWRNGELQRVGSQQGVTQARVRDVMEDSHGEIWVGTDTGLFRGGVDGFEPVGEDTEIGELSVSSLFEIDGEIWAMMQGAWMRVDDERVRTYTDGRGLSATVASFMTRIGDEIWATSHEGIQRIPLEQFDEIDRGERSSFEPRIYGGLDHPVIAQCNGGLGQAGLYQPDAGLLWCPSLEGVLILDVAQARQDPPPPRPRLARVRAGGEQHELGHVEAAELVLPPAVRDLEVDFAGLDFRWPKGVKHRFRLIGFDDEWVEAGARRTAFYTNLPPGDYRFEVLAGNEQGLYSDDPAVLTLKLEPSYYQTLWFRLLVSVLVLIMLYLGWRYSVRHLRRRGRLLEHMVRERTEQLKEVNRQLLDASLTDPLTGLRNRRFLVEQIPHDIAGVDRVYRRKGKHANEDISFLMVDLDHFKQINDRYGHTAGDQVLSRFAQLLQAQVRDSDYVVRWGGEEFLIVARHSEGDQATACAERIMAAVRSEVFDTDRGEINVSCSIGVATYPALAEQPEMLSWEEVIELADAANYLAKREGRDRWVSLALRPGAATAEFMPRFREQGIPALVDAGLLHVSREKSGEEA
ncbi:diguanylate cyclase [Wenzhouxiangella sp. AB-CW3]|uniref:ligand-binding sensor domain-containing diguanylate cyclase n=1 Tax=Wenzhouxiangella sp. AB-CW3 TaxID=2771012 RepID=UPI00168B809C|nr:ligand-binding sensor domain-containing diguanylate cyclase [Wenzhouxiangella sp. AB-CW3]QOC23431.1 diguanylate cyclase [Wenzhouxiangella sp. AB-CW3]